MPSERTVQTRPDTDACRLDMLPSQTRQLMRGPDILYLALITSHLALNLTTRTVTVEAGWAKPRTAPAAPDDVCLPAWYDTHRQRTVRPWLLRPETRMPNSLCETCRWVRIVTTSKGSRFLLCGLHATDPRFPKYPPQPVLHCRGFAPVDKSC